ncbi:MAG TPA: vitamin-B12 independent methionine synthase [Trichormus sp.]|jgi:5-methyltetrahydropteroyltriglutamate--homocysteine methyltransferase
MQPSERHELSPSASFDGGDLDCGSGLLLLIRKHIDPLLPGQLLEVISSEISVEEDLPAWCRLTKNELVSWTKHGKIRSYLICKGRFADSEPREGTRISGTSPQSERRLPAGTDRSRQDGGAPEVAPEVAPVADVKPCAVMGIGSWPRPNWLLGLLHERLEGRLSETDFQQAADDAVRLSIAAQMRAGVDVISDGEQRRDNYSSFVGNILDNCQLIPLVDLLPLVDDPEKFAAQMKSLDVPADKVRHPAVFGRISRSRPLSLHELEFAKTVSSAPIKVALPGPYLLTRTMWIDCITDNAYRSREELAGDIVKILQEEARQLLAAGAALVQFDEPVLSEVAFTGAKNTRSFMCGALGERGDTKEELAFALQLINQVVDQLPVSRTAMHICRGNWTRDETVALAGDYRALLPVLTDVNVGMLFLEFCTPRAGELKVIADIPASKRIGIGVVNPKRAEVEAIEAIAQRIEQATALVSPDRLVFTPDCGFATFADNPVASATIAEAKLKAVSEAVKLLSL